LGLPWRSRWFQLVLAVEVDDAREGFWSWCCEALVLLGSPLGGQCGQASQPLASSYGMRPSDEGAGPSARWCLVLFP
jgi:hypothetical protein